MRRPSSPIDTPVSGTVGAQQMPVPLSGTNDSQPLDPATRAAIIWSWVICELVFMPGEILRLMQVLQTPQPMINWLGSVSGESFLHLVWLLVGLLWWGRILITAKVPVESPATAPETVNVTSARYYQCWQPCLVAAGLTLFLNLLVSYSLGQHPPIYHDEYSYLFQAETFLAGRVTNPRFEAAPELFDQMHVLNLEPGHFASRYFPAVGLFLAPFVALGQLQLGYFLAGSMISVFICLAGCELGGNRLGWWAGCLCALIPGYALFSQLYLSHHPTLVGLSFFLWMMLRLLRTCDARDALLSGIGLTWAMLCRPMTAAGMAFPFGVLVLWNCLSLLIRNPTTAPQTLSKPPMSRWTSLSILCSLGFPILFGMLSMMIYNHAITGFYFKTPYQVYTENYTPRHVFGFHNRSRGEAWIQQHTAAGQPLPVQTHYDEWAEELTWPLAWQHFKTRALATGLWTFGLIPVLWSLVMISVLCFTRESHIDPRWKWIVASLLSLHLAHFPYWYDGIFHWHYVMEGGILLALLVGEVSRRMTLLAIPAALQVRPPDPAAQFTLDPFTLYPCAWWWSGGLLISGLLAFTSCDPFWDSLLWAGESQIKFAARKYETVNQKIQETCGKQPVVVIFVPDPSDLHIDHVVNTPTLDAPILRIRDLRSHYSLTQLAALFPVRDIYLYDVQSNTIHRLTP
jgi:hypothetical protein